MRPRRPCQPRPSPACSSPFLAFHPTISVYRSIHAPSTLVLYNLVALDRPGQVSRRRLVRLAFVCLPARLVARGPVRLGARKGNHHIELQPLGGPTPDFAHHVCCAGHAINHNLLAHIYAPSRLGIVDRRGSTTAAASCPSARRSPLSAAFPRSRSDSLTCHVSIPMLRSSSSSSNGNRCCISQAKQQQAGTCLVSQEKVDARLAAVGKTWVGRQS